MTTAAPNIIEHVYTPYGAIDELWDCQDPEVLLDGPAGTGKSRGALELMLRDAVNWPGSRQAIVRKTRVSLSDSALVTWETKVLGDGVDEAYLAEPLAGGPTRATRHLYRFANGSEIACHGMDNPTRLFSTEYDRIYVQEATELTENEWESLHRALRNNVMPYQQLLGDCNPDAEFHWLNQRCNAGKTTRLLSRHVDNPSLTPEYLERLSNLTGVRRKRLFEGLWVSAEGQIWPQFDAAVHVIDAVPVELRWYFGMVDWGYRNPGSMMIAGVDDERRAYIVEEWYRVQQNIEWWAEQAAKVQKRYDAKGGFRCFVCDPSRPDSIDLFNHRLYQRGDRNCAMPANNDFEAGANIVRERFANKRLFILRDSLCHPRDAELVEAKKPTRLVEEIPSYVYREIKDGQPVREEAALDGDDHAADALRYGCMYLDYSLWSPERDKPKPKPDTADARFRIEEQLQRLRSGLPLMRHEEFE